MPERRQAEAGATCSIARPLPRHIRTRPYTARTKGKAERFIQTALRDWSSGREAPPEGFFLHNRRKRSLLPASQDRPLFLSW